MATLFNEINYLILIQEAPWGTFLTEVAPRLGVYYFCNVWKIWAL